MSNVVFPDCFRFAPGDTDQPETRPCAASPGSPGDLAGDDSSSAPLTSLCAYRALKRLLVAYPCLEPVVVKCSDRFRAEFPGLDQAIVTILEIAAASGALPAQLTADDGEKVVRIIARDGRDFVQYELTHMKGHLWSRQILAKWLGVMSGWKALIPRQALEHIAALCYGMMRVGESIRRGLVAHRTQP